MDITMQKEMNNSVYEGFPYAAEQLKKFLMTAGIFTISLKGSTTVLHFTPDDAETFKEWLTSNGVKDMRKDKPEL